MAIIMKKETNAERAKKWVEFLNTDERCQQLINCCSTQYYSNPVVADFAPTIDNKFGKTEVEVYKQDVCVCAKASKDQALPGDRIAVLDFASYSNPGGSFLKGSMAQEEALCHNSALYVLLKRDEEIYTERKKKGFKPYYGHDFIYYNDMPFFFNREEYLIDTFVVAAPNRMSRADIGEAAVDELIKVRMEIIFTAMASLGATVVLLGAFGCGVFGNNVKMVAEHWKYLTNVKYSGVFRKVVHPVLDAKQYKVFKNICTK